MTEGVNGSARRRAPNACVRCRHHKIKCSGSQPCNTCARRRQICVFNDRLKFSQSYIEELQRKVDQAEHRHDERSAQYSEARDKTVGSSNVGLVDDEPAASGPGHRSRSLSAHSQDVASDSSRPLINHLAMGQTVYLPDPSGQAIYLGTSSSWSFGRRVLLLAQERIMKAPLSPGHLLWEGRAYDLSWNGSRDQATTSTGTVVIPEADFGMFLLNAVKFHVGQLFHLFDETEFMDNFTKFYAHDSDATTTTTPLWYNHYLLILAFGKAFTSRAKRADRKPHGCVFFTKAMATLPDPNFANLESFEIMEILCCAALYLHSLDFRGSAYNLIGQALRIALQKGFHTDMSASISGRKLERARRIWWTVLLLDRQMSSSMGLPPAIADEYIESGLPNYGSVLRAQALEIHVKLSSVMFMIVSKVYGKEGRINSKFLVHTRAALRGVADVTNELNRSFALPLDTENHGISRVSAYLHILHHQCIIMSTRPILFSYFDARLSRDQHAPRALSESSSTRALMKMCIDSAVHMLQILASLQTQGLLESFLSFDVDAAYNSAVVLQMAAHIEVPLLDDDTPWLEVAYACFDEMISCGNRSADTMKSELQRLHNILGRASPQRDQSSVFQRPTDTYPVASQAGHSRRETSSTLTELTSVAPSAVLSDGTINQFSGYGPALQDGLNAEQMMMVADAIDLDGIDWWFNRTDEIGQLLDA